jgi:hypothetical protein
MNETTTTTAYSSAGIYKLTSSESLCRSSREKNPNRI